MKFDRIQSADVKGCDFDCGVHALNDYFKRFAVGNDRIGVGRTYVIRNADDANVPRILGFATLSMASVEADKLPEDLRKQLPRYPMPVALLGRFAVDKRTQGRGLGAQMISELFGIILELSEKIGCIGVAVDAKDQTAISFYAKFGFGELPNQNGQFPRRLFIAIGTIKAARTPVV